MSSFGGHSANKEFWAQDKLDSEQKILKIRTNEESLSEVSGQGKGHGKLAQNPRVDGLLAKAIAKKYIKQQLLKKQKATKAQQAKQAGSGAKVGGAKAASPVKAEQ